MISIRIIAALSFLVLSGCAHQAGQVNIPLQARVEILDPKIDLSHLPRPILRSFVVNVQEPDERKTVQMLKSGVHMAVECNSTQTQCKHAAVLPVLTYQLVRSGGNSAVVSGTFDVKVGRSLTSVDEGAMSSFSMTRSVDERVEVIEEGHFKYPVNASLKLGQSYVVEGRLGTKVIITLQSALQ